MKPQESISHREEAKGETGNTTAAIRYLALFKPHLLLDSERTKEYLAERGVQVPNIDAEIRNGISDTLSEDWSDLQKMEKRRGVVGAIFWGSAVVVPGLSLPYLYISLFPYVLLIIWFYQHSLWNDIKKRESEQAVLRSVLQIYNDKTEPTRRWRQLR